MRDIGKMMKQVQKMQAEVARVQEEMKVERVEASAGGGVVRAVANLHGDIQEIRIDPAAVDPGDVGMLQDLILAALGEVQRTARSRAAEKMRAVTGGLPLPPGLV